MKKGKVIGIIDGYPVAIFGKSIYIIESVCDDAGDEVSWNIKVGDMVNFPDEWLFTTTVKKLKDLVKKMK